MGDQEMRKTNRMAMLIIALFLLMPLVVFAPGFGDASPDTGTPDNGTVMNSTDGSNYIDGNFTSTQADDNVYFTAGRNNPGGVGDDLEAFINLTYNITPLQPSHVRQLIFNISYCQTRDVASPSICGGNGAQGTANTMDVEIYNWTSGIYVDIGNIVATNSETAAAYYVNGSFADFVNSTNRLINIRYEANYTLGNGQDAVFSIDYAPLAIIYDNITPAVILNLPVNNFNTTSSNVTINFTAVENNATVSCSLYFNGVLNQTNSTVLNNTLTNFFVGGLSHGNYNWSVSCSDAVNAGASDNRTFFVNRTPVLDSVNDSPDPIKGGNVITINASGISDPNNDTLYFYCDNSTAPTSGNTDCTGGTTTDTTSPYSLSCTFAVASDDAAHTEFCRVYDGESYSSARNTTYTADSTPPTTTINNVAGDTQPTYFDTTNDGITNITIDGESGMICRWSTTDLSYSSMSNTCTTSGTQAACPATTATQGLPDFYVSCQDSLGNGQNSTQNTDVTALVVDWTEPTTSDNSSSVVQSLGYNVTITESDNIDGDPATLYCTDTANSCTPNTVIDNGGKITFNSRGIYYLRYNSSDDAGNAQSIVSKTINVNNLPAFSSATGDAATIRGGATVTITTVASDSDSGQALALYVCKTSSANASGCSNSTNHYCNATSTSNPTCSFASESDNTAHTWYAFIFDGLNESAAANPLSGSYTTDSAIPSITILYPANATYTTENITATIILDESGSWAGYCLDACTANISMPIISSKVWSATMENLSSIQHYVKFYSNDSAGNMANSSVVYFIINAIAADTTQPAITVISPLNASYYTSTILLNISLNENGTWAGYVLDSGSMASLSNYTNTNWNATISGLADETQHNITFYANDSSNNQGSKTAAFFVDISAPRYSSVNANPSPVNQSQSVICSAYWQDGFNITTALVEENSTGFLENHSIAINNRNGWANYTIVGSKLSNIGNYTCRFYATDAAGNSNSTSITFIVQDIAAPSLIIVAPSNATYSQNSVGLEVHSDEALRSAYYCLDSCISNTSMANTSSTLWQASPTIENGQHTIKFYGNDTSNNIGTVSISFSTDSTLADTTVPAITVYSPVNGTYTGASVLLNISLNENGTWAGYVLNGGSLVSLGNYTNTNWNATLSGLADETQHNITFYANDSSSNNNQGSKAATFFVDVSAPRYNFVSASPSIANESQAVVCSAYWQDGFNITSAKIGENTTGSFINHTIVINDRNGWSNYTTNSLAKGSYTCIFYATDAAGNSNSTYISFIVHDVTAPVITITSPLNSTYNTRAIVLNIIASENITWANYSLDNAANASMTGSGTFWSKTIENVANGQHTVDIYASDASGNNGNSTIRFTVDLSVLDTTPPVLTPRSPLNGTYYNSSAIVFNITSNENIAWAGYSLNGTALQQLSNISARIWNSTLALTDGAYNLTFYGNDSSSNQGNTTDNVLYFFVDTVAPRNSTTGFTPSSPSDTSSVTCYSAWTDNVALDYGFVEHNTSGSFVNSTNVTLSGTTGDVNFTFTVNITTPSAVGCRFYAYDKSGQMNRTEMSTMNIADTTKPVFSNFTYAPNATAELDPNVIVNVTVNASDNRAINNVTLRYRLANESSYAIILMTPSGGTGYNASFNATEGNWTLYVNITDASGNANVTNEINISALNDETWLNTTTITAIKAFTLDQRTSNNTLGNLTINNTGDYALNFTITAISGGNRATLNNTRNTTISLTIPAKSIATISAEANTTGLASGLYNYSIFIQAIRNGTIVSTDNASLQLSIQNVAGPLLSVTIETYSSSVSKGASGVAYSAKVQNLGTGDATGAWLAWTLPSDFIIETGSQNRSIGNLPIGTSATNTITVSVSSSTTDKNTTVNATAGSNENSAGSDSKTVTIGSPVVVTTTVTQTVTAAGGGGDSTGITASALVEKLLTGEEILTSSEVFELVRGDENSFPVGVKNIFEKATLYNASIEISGFMSQYMFVYPVKIHEIKFNETKKFNVTIKSPSYMETGSHQLNITIRGKLAGQGIRKDLTETRFVKLIIHTISREEAYKIIEAMMKDVSDMKNAGFRITKVSKLTDEAKKSAEGHDYEKVKNNAESVRISKDAAFRTYDSIQKIRGKIKGYASVTGAFLGIQKNFPETEKLVNLATAAFEREDYEAALNRVNDAQLTMEIEKGEFRLLYFLSEFWWAILLVLAFLFVAWLFIYKLYMKSLIANRIRNLGREEENIVNLIKETQEKRFREKGIDAATFRKAISQYQSRLAKIRQVRVKLRHKRLKLLKTRDLMADLNEEREEIISLLKSTQERYFIKGGMSKAEYNGHSNILNERLAEIEDEQMTAEMMAAKKGSTKPERKITIINRIKFIGRIKARISLCIHIISNLTKKPERIPGQSVKITKDSAMADKTGSDAGVDMITSPRKKSSSAIMSRISGMNSKIKSLYCQRLKPLISSWDSFRIHANAMNSKIKKTSVMLGTLGITAVKSHALKIKERLNSRMKSDKAVPMKRNEHLSKQHASRHYDYAREVRWIPHHNPAIVKACIMASRIKNLLSKSRKGV